MADIRWNRFTTSHHAWKQQAPWRGRLPPSFLSHSPPELVHEQTPDRPKRSLTPRGHIFRDFSEAHRNIIGNNRLKSNNPFATPTHDSSHDIPLQDLSSPSLPDSNGKMLGGQLSRRPAEFVSAYPQRLDSGRSLTHNERISQSSSMCALSSAIENVSDLSSEEVVGETTAKNQNPDASKSTVGKILHRYVETGIRRQSSHGSLNQDYVLTFPKIRGRNRNSSQPAQSHSNPPCQKPSAQDSGRAGSPAGNRHTKPLLSTPTRSVSPNKSMLDTPDDDVRTRTRPLSHEDVTITESDPSFIDEDTLRYLRHDHRSLLPMPLRVPSDANDVFADPVHQSDPRVEANSSSEGGSFFDSHSDPFKYDSREYRAVLQAAKEREISQALEVGADTECALTYPGNKPAGEDIVNANDKVDRTATRPHLAHSKGSFFDARTMDALGGYGPKPECDDGDIRMIIMTLKAQGHVLDNDSEEATKEGDWVTEATSEVGFDTGATAPSSDDGASQVIKATGSSVADISDHESDEAPLRRFNSRNHILRHPPGDITASSKRYNVRDLKDTKQRVMLPRPNIPRVNGFAHNSLRVRPDVPFRSNLHPFPPNMRPQISNPFTRRRSGYQRAEPSSYFSHARDRTKASKYDFRDSGSSYGQVSAMNQATRGTYDTLPSTSMGSINTHKVLELANAQVNPYDERRDTEIQNPGPSRDRSIEDAYFDPGEQSQPVATVSPTDNRTTPTGTNFPFPLLDLHEAQDLQMKQRESGVTDETEDSTQRYQRAMSGTVGRDMATPTQLQQPRRAYVHRNSSTRRFRRASTLSSCFSPPSWLVGGDKNGLAVLDTPTPTAGERGSMTPITNVNTANSKAPRINWFTIGQPPRQPRLLPVDKSARRNGGHAIDEPSVTDVESAEVDITSPWGCQRRKQFFYMTLVLSILPFFGVMALHGSFNTLLASYTDDKVFRLTKKQRDTIKLMLVVEAVIYILIAIIVILVHVS
ncbi:hypothetical protein PG994_009246 [Apiospora phragmitis]|uniref:Uncharacterized protein n=1 Tax=Apiospora phragmitis TaxID=2905665 RepID=A0ABR1UIQ4_9PEZI